MKKPAKKSGLNLYDCILDATCYKNKQNLVLIDPIPPMKILIYIE